MYLRLSYVRGPVFFVSTLGVMALVVLGCTHTLSKASLLDRPNGILSGTVTYRERIALPRDTTLHLILTQGEGESKPTKNIAEEIIPTRGQQVPIVFALNYNRDLIKPQFSYRLKAEILFRGQLWFTSDLVEVLTKGNPDEVHLVMKRTP